MTSGSDVLDEITPADSDGTYTYDPGDTVFRVDNVTLFSCRPLTRLARLHLTGFAGR